MTIENFLGTFLQKQGVESITFITPYVGYIEVKSIRGERGQIEFSFLTDRLDIVRRKVETFYNCRY